jgi:hypothetical protein
MKAIYERLRAQVMYQAQACIQQWLQPTRPSIVLRYALFADYTLYIWACRALSQLLCASLSEDTLGVVTIHQSLPRTLITLANCLQHVHHYVEHLASEHPLSKRPAFQGHLLTFLPAHALTVTLSTALMRLIITFYSSLNLYEFPPHILPLIQEFVHFVRT